MEWALHYSEWGFDHSEWAFNITNGLRMGFIALRRGFYYPEWAFVTEFYKK